MNGTELSIFDRFKIWITPKSHAESLVDEVYGPEGRGLIPVPQTYDPEVAEQPASYVEVKQAVTGRIDKAVEAIQSRISGVQGSFVKLGIIAFLAIAALVAINAFVRR